MAATLTAWARSRRRRRRRCRASWRRAGRRTCSPCRRRALTVRAWHRRGAPPRLCGGDDAPARRRREEVPAAPACRWRRHRPASRLARWRPPATSRWHGWRAPHHFARVSAGRLPAACSSRRVENMPEERRAPIVWVVRRHDDFRRRRVPAHRAPPPDDKRAGNALAKSLFAVLLLAPVTLGSALLVVCGDCSFLVDLCAVVSPRADSFRFASQEPGLVWEEASGGTYPPPNTMLLVVRCVAMLGRRPSPRALPPPPSAGAYAAASRATAFPTGRL